MEEVRAKLQCQGCCKIGKHWLGKVEVEVVVGEGGRVLPSECSQVAAQPPNHYLPSSLDDLKTSNRRGEQRKKRLLIESLRNKIRLCLRSDWLFNCKKTCSNNGGKSGSEETNLSRCDQNLVPRSMFRTHPFELK